MKEHCRKTIIQLEWRKTSGGKVKTGGGNVKTIEGNVKSSVEKLLLVTFPHYISHFHH